MSKNKKSTAEPLYELSATNMKMANYKSYKMSLNEKLLYFILAFAAGAAVAYLFYGGIGKVNGKPTTVTYVCDMVIMSLIGLIAAFIFMPLRRGQIITARKKKLRRQFIDLLDSLASSVSAGKNMPDAFAGAREDLLVQYQPDSFIINEVDNIIEGIRNNVDISAMLVNFGQRSGIDDIKTFGKVFEVAYSTGADMREVIRNCHLILSSKCEIEGDIEAKVASNKNEQYVMMIMPIVLVLMIKLSDSDFSANFATPTGIICTTAAIAMFLVSYFIGRMILKIEV